MIVCDDDAQGSSTHGTQEDAPCVKHGGIDPPQRDDLMVNQPVTGIKEEGNDALVTSKPNQGL